MISFPVQSHGSAPAASRPPMQAMQPAFGSLPSIAASMATSPILIGGLVGLFDRVYGGSFSDTELQTLLLTDAIANQASWAVAFRSFLAREQGIDADDVDAIRAGGTPADAKLAALSSLTRTVIERRRHLDEAAKQTFLDAGYTA